MIYCRRGNTVSFRIEYKDITGYEVDAIVMPANPKPKIGYGVDRLIYHRVGRNRLFNDRKRIFSFSVCGFLRCSGFLNLA